MSEQIERNSTSTRRRDYQATQQAISQGQDPAGVDVMVQRSNPFLMNDKYQLQQYEDELADMQGRWARTTARCRRSRPAWSGCVSVSRRSSTRRRPRRRWRSWQVTNRKRGLQRRSSKSITARVDNLKESLGDLSNSMIQYYSCSRRKRAWSSRQGNQGTDRERAGIAVRHASEDVVWRAMPEVPMNKSFPKLPVTMAVAIAMGLMLSVGVAFLRAAMDQSIRRRATSPRSARSTCWA